MAIPLQSIMVIWHPRNMKKFVYLGYKFTRIGEIFWADYRDVLASTPSSKSLLSVQCDFCDNYFTRAVKRQKRIEDIEISKKDCCSDSRCIVKKKTEGSFIKYGVNNPQQHKSVRDKTLETNLKRYGVEHYILHDSFKDKSKETSLLNHGVSHPSMSAVVKNKRRATNLEKYGYINVSQSAVFKKKIAESYYLNGSVKTSKPQMKVYEMLKEAGYQVELNYPVSIYNTDIGLFYKGLKIDVEYDGWYWHQDRQKDIDRDSFMVSEGWKVLRVKSGVKVPKLIEMEEAIDLLVRDDRTYGEIVLDDWKQQK